MANSFLASVRGSLEEKTAKRNLNKRLFAVVAPRYQAATRILSLWRDQKWKQEITSMVLRHSPETVVDLASGTGDIALMISSRFSKTSVLALDLSPDMLRVFRERSDSNHLHASIGDMSRICVKDRFADAVTGGYALRNAPDPVATIEEIHRILKPGGKAFFLEFSRAPNRALWLLEYTLLKFWGGICGLLFHGDPRVYSYIAESLRTYPDRNKLHALLASKGFQITDSRMRMFGMIELLEISKPEF